MSSLFAVPYIAHLPILPQAINGRMLGLRTLGSFGHPNSLLLESGLGLVTQSMLGVLMHIWAVKGLFKGPGQGFPPAPIPAPHPRGWRLREAGALSFSLTAHGAPSPSGTACKPETLFQGTEGSEPGEGSQAPGTAQQPKVQGVALPGLGRAKGWSFDGKQEVRGVQGSEMRVLWVSVYHPPLPIPPSLVSQ